MGAARKKLDWKAQEELSIDPERFREVRKSRGTNTDACSMCGEFCVYKILENLL